jgi:uncharacterized DUF497 family protein
MAAIVHEWVEAKRRANLRKHGVDFVSVEAFGWDQAVTFEDIRDRSHEHRWVAFGPIGGMIFALVFTEPEDGVTRVISLRRATKRERRLYAKEFEKARG